MEVTCDADVDEGSSEADSAEVECSLEAEAEELTVVDWLSDAELLLLLLLLLESLTSDELLVEACSSEDVD